VPTSKGEGRGEWEKGRKGWEGGREGGKGREGRGRVDPRPGLGKCKGGNPTESTQRIANLPE